MEVRATASATYGGSSPRRAWFNVRLAAFYQLMKLAHSAYHTARSALILQMLNADSTLKREQKKGKAGSSVQVPRKPSMSSAGRLSETEGW
jgi:hypothetical protein